MLVSDLLGAAVACGGEHVGVVVDVRFVGEPGAREILPVMGLIVGPRRGAAFLGYERQDLSRPALLNRYFAWRRRDTFLVDVKDVASVGEQIELRAGFTRWSARLRAPSASTG